MKTAQKILPLYTEDQWSIKELLTRIKSLEAQLESTHNLFVYPTEDGLEFLESSKIIRCEASGNYTLLILNNGEKRCLTKCLKWVEDRLSTSHFLRIHNSHIVQIQKIRKYLKGSIPLIELANGESVPVSRSKKSLIHQTFCH